MEPVPGRGCCATIGPMGVVGVRSGWLSRAAASRGRVLWVDGMGMRMETVWSGRCLRGLGLFAITSLLRDSSPASGQSASLCCSHTHMPYICRPWPLPTGRDW